MQFQAQAPFAISALQAIAQAEVAMPHELLALAGLQNSFIKTGGLFFYTPSAHHHTAALFASTAPHILTKAVNRRSAHACNVLGVRHKYIGPTVVVGTAAEIALTEEIFMATSPTEVRDVLTHSDLSIKQKTLYGAFLNTSWDRVEDGVDKQSIWLLRNLAVKLGKKQTPGADALVLTKALRSYSFGTLTPAQFEEIRTGRLKAQTKEAAALFPAEHIDLALDGVLAALAGKIKFHKEKDH